MVFSFIANLLYNFEDLMAAGNKDHEGRLDALY